MNRSPGAPRRGARAAPAWNTAPRDAEEARRARRAFARASRAVQTSTSRRRCSSRITRPTSRTSRGRRRGVFGFLRCSTGGGARFDRGGRAIASADVPAVAASNRRGDEAGRSPRGRAEGAGRMRRMLAATLFGEAWQGEHSAGTRSSRTSQWVVEFRACVTRHDLGDRAIALAAQRAPDVDAVHALRERDRRRARHARAAATAVWLADAATSPTAPFAGAAAARSRRSRRVPRAGPRWAAFERRARRRRRPASRRELPRRRDDGHGRRSMSCRTRFSARST